MPDDPNRIEPFLFFLLSPIKLLIGVFLLAVNDSKVKTASKLCSALTLSGLVEVKEVCWETAFFAGNLTLGH